MIENAIRIAVDPIFPPSPSYCISIGKKSFIPDKIIENNKFELIFDEVGNG